MDSTKFRAFEEKAKEGNLLARRDTRIPGSDFPAFVFQTEHGQLMTEPNVKALNALTAFAKKSGLWPELPELILALRIPRANLSANVQRYLWTAMEADPSNISLGEWAQSRGYRRSPSSSRLEQAPPAVTPPTDTPVSTSA